MQRIRYQEEDGSCLAYYLLASCGIIARVGDFSDLANTSVVIGVTYYSCSVCTVCMYGVCSCIVQDIIDLSSIYSGVTAGVPITPSVTPSIIPCLVYTESLPTDYPPLSIKPPSQLPPRLNHFPLQHREPDNILTILRFDPSKPDPLRRALFSPSFPIIPVRHLRRRRVAI